MFELPEPIPGLAAALATGLLIGLERERRKEDEPRMPAGIRTFTLIALAGAIASLLGPAMVVLGGAVVGVAAGLAFWRSPPEDPGLTTEIAMLVAYLLGALAVREPALAAGLGVVVAVILAGKGRLHDFAQRVLTPQELRDGLMLAAAALIVLPLLPSTPLDPWDALDPRRLWTIVVLVMAINAAGYIALRAVGLRLGLVIAGLAGGFVSSTATIGSMGSRAKADPELRGGAVAAALASNVATVVQLAVMIGASSMVLLRAMAVPLVAAGLAAVAAAALGSWRSLRSKATDDALLPGRAFEPRHALIFAAIVGAVLLISAAIHERFGEYGFEVAIAAAGFADTHAPAASAAQLHAAGSVTLREAMLAVFGAFATNSVSKILIGFGAGGWRFGLRLLPGIVAIAAAFGAALWLYAIPEAATTR